MTNHQKDNIPFHRSRLPLRPEEATITLLEPTPGHPQVIVNGIAYPISEKSERKLRDLLNNKYKD